MKLFTLKRFFVVTLLMCLGIGQSWAVSETKTITLNAKSAENGVLSWTSEDGMVTFTLTPVPEYQNEGRFKMAPSTTYRLTWTHNYDRVKYDFGINKFVETFAAIRDDGEYRLGIEIKTSSGVNVGSNSANLWTGDFEPMYENWDGSQWRTLMADLTEPLGEDGYIELNVGPADQAVLGFIARRHFEYYLQKMEVTYTVTEMYRAKVNVVATEGGSATVNDKTGSDNLKEAVSGAESNPFVFRLAATVAAENYEFLGWSYTDDGEIISNDNPYNHTIICDAINTSKEEKLYARFNKLYDEVKMGKKQYSVDTQVNYYKKTTTAPTNGSNTGFFIASSDMSWAIATNASNAVEGPKDTEYYDKVNESGKPYTFTLDSNGRLLCSNGQYLNNNSNHTALVFTNQASNARQWTVTRNGNSSSTNMRISYTRNTGFLQWTTYYLTISTEGVISLSTSATNLAIYTATSRIDTDYFDVDPLEFAIKADYATVYCEDAYLMPRGENGEVLTGYFVKGADADGEYLTLDEKYHSGEIVPAGTALLIEGPQSMNYKAIKYVVKTNGTNTDPIAKEYTDADKNQLEGTRVNGLTHSKHEDTNPGDVLYYKLSYGPSGTKYDDVLGFWYGAQDGGAFKPTNPYTAFLAVVKGAVTPAHGYSLPMGDDDTLNSIEIVETSNSANDNDAVYTISGMRVNDSKNLPAGIYIRNGKKFMVR